MLGWGVCNEVKDSPLLSTHKDGKTLRQIIERENKPGGITMEGKGGWIVELVSLVSKVQHMGEKNIERTGETDGFCDIRAKAIIMKAHRTREKKKKDGQ